jgi:plastocyanin
MKRFSFALCAIFVCALAVTVPGAGASAQDDSGSSHVATVHMTNFAFDPDKLTIHPGDKVVFVNDDDVAHTVTAKDRSFDSQSIDGHAKWSHVFTDAGTYTYVCAYHPGMSGTIVVVAPK